MDSKFIAQDLFEWVELLEPSSQKVIFANLESGEIRWDSPPNARVRPLASEQWWELYDVKTQRHYYHNVHSGKTEWDRPSSGDIIPLSNLQLIKQLSSSEGTMDKDIGVMHRHKLCPASGARNSIHMTPQDHRKMSVPVSATPPVAARHPVTPSPGRPASQRRRNSQPTRSASTAGHAAVPQRQSLTRCVADNALAVTANQRVTEWLRSAGSLPEEAEDEATQFQPQKALPSSVATQTPQTRWGTTRGVSSAAYQVKPNSTTRHAFSTQQLPPTTTPYDRRVVPMVPPPPPPPPLHGRASADTLVTGQESAFANLLYDLSSNVVTSKQHQFPPTTPLTTEMAALGLTPRSVPRTNPHAVVTAGTMPRLSCPKPQLLPIQSPPLPAVTGAATAKLRNGHGAVNAVISSSPDTEITNSASASASASYSGDSEPEEKEPHAICKEALMSSNDVSTYSKEDIFEQHPFRPATVHPVDEYTFTVPRQHPTNLQQPYLQQPLPHNHQCPPGTPNDWALLPNQQQLQSAMTADDADQAPPTPPPRLASAMNTMQFGRAPRTTSMTAVTTQPVESTTWQTFDVPPASGFLPRSHPFRQPLKQPPYTTPTANTVASVEDDISEDPGLTHTSTRSLLSASSSAHESATVGTTGSTHSPHSTTAAPLHPRRSASGGFIGPADAEAASLSSSSAIAATARAPIEQSTSVSTTIACSGSTHFALISGPYSWPKNLLRQSQDCTTLMNWTKAAFSKRLLAATDKSLQKHIPENFKLVQSFMGDRIAKLSKPDLASIIVQRALATPGVRDELYAQLCKQTTGNYNADSLMRGWELICICLYFFPPNKVFRDPLHAYLTARSEALSIALAPPPLSSATSSTSANASTELCALRPGPSLAAAAALAAGSDPAGLISTPVTPAFGVPLADTSGGADGACEANVDAAPSSEFPYGPWVKLSALHFTRAAPRWFMRSVAVGAVRASMPPSKEELLHVKDFLLKPGIFGSSLEEMMKIQSCRFPSLRLPWIQIFLTEELLRLNGAKAEGIFRVSADQDVLTSVRFQLEKLFEVFRVLEVSSRDLNPAFTIVRPPPKGWSHSQRVFAPEPSSPVFSDPSITATRSALLPCPALTGSFSLPLKPSPIPSHPAEYMLLTPRSLWPGDLAGFGESGGASGGGNTEKGSFLDPHLAAALLKLWLREMATPLVPPALAPEVFAAAIEAEALEKSAGAATAIAGTSQIEKCCAMVRRLPRINRRVLLYLIKLCQHLVRQENACTSLMDARNLATVIAPNLFRSTSNNPSELLNSVQSQTAFTRLLICHLNVDAEAALLNATTSEAAIETEAGPEYEVETGAENASYSLHSSVSR